MNHWMRRPWNSHRLDAGSPSVGNTEFDISVATFVRILPKVAKKTRRLIAGKASQFIASERLVSRLTFSEKGESDECADNETRSYDREYRCYPCGDYKGESFVVWEFGGHV